MEICVPLNDIFVLFLFLQGYCNCMSKKAPFITLIWLLQGCNDQSGMLYFAHSSQMQTVLKRQENFLKQVSEA